MQFLHKIAYIAKTANPCQTSFSLFSSHFYIFLPYFSHRIPMDTRGPINRPQTETLISYSSLNLVTDNGNECINEELTSFCRVYNVQFKPRTL